MVIVFSLFPNYAFSSDSVWNQEIESLGGSFKKLEESFNKQGNLLMIVENQEDMKAAFTAVTLIESFDPKTKPDWLIVAALPESKIRQEAVRTFLQERFKSPLSRNRILLSVTKDFSNGSATDSEISLSGQRTVFVGTNRQSYQALARSARKLNSESE